MASDRTAFTSAAERAYGEYAAQPVEERDFDAFCAARPDLAQELRRLHALVQRIEGLLPARPLSARLAERYGSEVDPHVALAGADDEEERAGGHASDFSSDVLGRLAQRRGAFGRYALKGEIARGGQGAVVRVWDGDLRRALAMKILLGKAETRASGETPPVDARTLGRFLEEAQVTGQLDHPGIVPVHELGLDSDGRVYFTMKLVKGRTLKTILDLVAERKEGWTQARALGVLHKVCEAMAYAHHKGVVHRDLKPANVMVGRFGEVFVMDWGLAKVLGRRDAKDVRIAPQPPTQDLKSERLERGEAVDSPLVTMDGVVVGTPAYMPPEQAAGRTEEIGAHSDVYAVGAILYHLLAGHMPYVEPGMRLSNYDVWYLVQKGPPAPLAERAADAPAELAAICERAMACEIGARYRDMGELATELSAFLEHRVVAAYESGAWAEARKWIERNRPLAAALAAAVLLLAAGLVTSLVFKARAEESAKLAARRADETAEQARIAKANERRALAGEAEAGRQEEIARANEETAKAEAVRADAQERVATQRADDVLSLSASKDLGDLIARAETLWPALPELADDYERWLADARALLEGRPADPARGLKKRPSLEEHRAKLEELRLRATPLAEEEAHAERESHPGFAALAHRTAEPATVKERRTYAFDDPEASWWHAQLSKLVSDLEALADPETGLMGDTLAEPFGWGVTRRYELARTIGERSVEGPEAKRLWDGAIAAIAASPRYGGLALAPQTGLLPIGADPESGLWEFADLQTGAPAERRADGKLVLKEATGLVFVLLPGGSFLMGTQQSDPDAANYDPRARGNEGPVHEVTLSPCFMSKYEMTQGQWQRFAGRNPSYYHPPGGLAPSLLHPVEQMSWNTCWKVCARLGLSLPSEAQWEYGARGGTDTPWWTGRERESLRGRVNLADQTAKRAGATWSDINDWPELEDGWAVHAPIGTFAANAFGLHEVAGNVWEWCLDGDAGGFYQRSPREDPVAPSEGSAPRVYRGGGFRSAVVFARSATRLSAAPENADGNLGLRPARNITP